MQHVVKLIGQPTYDWAPLLELAYKATGKRLADEADESPRKFTTCERIASCLRCFSVGTGQTEFDHISLTFVLVVDERVLDEVITELGTLMISLGDSQTRAIMLIVTGSFAQWRRHSEEASGALWDDIKVELQTILPFNNQKRLA